MSGSLCAVQSIPSGSPPDVLLLKWERVPAGISLIDNVTLKSCGVVELSRPRHVSLALWVWSACLPGDEQPQFLRLLHDRDACVLLGKVPAVI